MLTPNFRRMAVQKRPGYSLVEVMLVMAILVILAGLSVPVLNSMMSGSKLSEARDFIQSALTQARSKAIESGTSYRFQIKRTEYRIVPDEQTEDNEERKGRKLPKNVCFCGTNSEGGTVSDSSWQTVATFHPNGTAEEDVEIRFQVGKSEPVLLKLRATTGAVTTAMVEAENYN